MADKLGIYNLALTHLGERRLASLTEGREPRRKLDAIWSQVQQECLEEGLWNFMIRSIQTDASTTIVPGFGWRYAFNIPNDWVRTTMVSTVETFTPPLEDYAEETGFWYASFTPLFVRYQSSDPLYGQNIGSWSGVFAAFVAFKLAEYACFSITGSDERLKGPDGILKRCYKAKIKAKSNDAMNEPPGHLPTGTWARSRRGFLRGVPLPGGTQYDD